MLLVEGVQQRQFADAGRAPGGPEIQYQRLAAEGGKRHRAIALRRRFTFVYQPVQGPLEARQVAEQQGFAQTVEIVAGDVEHGIADLFRAQLAGRVE